MIFLDEADRSMGGMNEDHGNIYLVVGEDKTMDSPVSKRPGKI
jgi:hypothetical protein